MKSRMVAFLVVAVLAALSACAAPTDALDGAEKVGSTSAALGIGPSSAPFPAKFVNGTPQLDPTGHPIPYWTGTIVDVLAADAWAQCGAHATSAAQFATDTYLAYLEGKIDETACPNTFSGGQPTADFNTPGCDAAACASKMKRWAWQRRRASCNVDTSTRAQAVVGFFGNATMGHALASSSPANTSPEFSGLAGSAANVNGAVAAAQKEVDIAEVNLCMAQRLRENMASADSLFLSAADLRQLLEVIRERAQTAMLQYALLGRVFTNPDDAPGGPAYPTQAFITLMHWSKQSSALAHLRDMGDELVAAVQIHVDATRELAEVLVRSASARVDRGGVPTTNPQSDFGSGSWRQRLLALLYGGNPLRRHWTPAEIEPWTMTSEQLFAISEGPEAVPWDAEWAFDDVEMAAFPNFFPTVTPAQPYAKTSTSDPQVAQLLALARKADALYLKEQNADYVLQVDDDEPEVAEFTARRVDVEVTAPKMWALVEAWLRTEECRKTNPSCTIGVDDPAMPLPEAYASSLLWRKYNIQPAHASTLVSMLTDVVPLLAEGEVGKFDVPSLASVPYEQEGAMHVTGGSRTLTAAELSARLPGHQAETWYRLHPDFAVASLGNAERAPLYTVTAPLFVPRAFVKANVPRAQGFGNASTPIRRVGAISALTLARTLLEDSIAAATTTPTQTYLLKTPHAVTVIEGAIGQRALSIRPTTTVQNLYKVCSDLDPSASTPSTCPTIVQTSSSDGLTARWAMSVRTSVDDPFFDSGPVSLVIVPFKGGLETSASLDATFSSFKGATRATLLESAEKVEVALSAPTPILATSEQREAVVDLKSKTAIKSYWWGGGNSAFTVFLKRTVAGQVEYQLLAQRLSLRTDIASRLTSSSTSALIALPNDGQFIGHGGVLGEKAARAWAARADDLSKPGYDGFGLETNWVPPFDPSLLGVAGDDASTTYLRHARGAADEATNAVKSAIDELLKEQSDSALAATAQRRAAGIAQLEQRALCGDAKPNCDTETIDVDLETYLPTPACSGNLCTRAELIRNRVVPRTAKLAKAVYQYLAHINAQTPPAFNEYSGGKMQAVLIDQWTALRKLHLAVTELATGAAAQQLLVAAADAELALSSAAEKYECSDEAKYKAYLAGFSYPVELGTGPGPGLWATTEGENFQWSSGALLAQEQACDRAELAMPAAEAKYASVISQGWHWMASQTTHLLEAGAAFRLASAELARTVQGTNLAKAQAQLEASLAVDALVTKFGTYRRYHSYDVWRARGLLESTRRYAVAARRAIEARYVVDLSEMRGDEPFVAAPATWADEIYEYDLAAPSSVGLTAIPTNGAGIYPNRLVDYIGNLERFVNGYAIARPTAIARSDDEVFHVSGPDARIDGALLGDVAGWEFRCPNGTWVQHPGLDAATSNAAISTICGGHSPTRARVTFTLDPWGRLNGDIANPPYAKRHNARRLELAVNLVGTGLRNCAVSSEASSRTLLNFGGG